MDDRRLAAVLAALSGQGPARPPTPLTVHLGRRRRHLGISQHALARALGVTQPAVHKWDHGGRSPRFDLAVAYASHLHWRLALHDSQRVLAEGVDILGVLPGLRRAADLRQEDLAVLLRVSRSAVAMYEYRGMTVLSCVEAYAAGLGLSIGVADRRGALVDTGRRAA